MHRQSTRHGIIELSPDEEAKVKAEWAENKKKDDALRAARQKKLDARQTLKDAKTVADLRQAVMDLMGIE